MSGDQVDGVKTNCLCGVHVHTGTKIVMWLNVILSGLYILGLFIALVIVLASPNMVENQGIAKTARTAVTLTGSGLVFQFIFNIIGSAIGLAPTAMVLYGLKTSRPGFYWPYLILAIIAIVTFVGYLIISSLILIAVAVGLVAMSTRDQSKTLLAGGALLLNAFLILVVVAFIYFNFIIVNRSRKLLESEMYHPVSHQVVQGSHPASYPVSHKDEGSHPSSYPAPPPYNPNV